MTHATRFTTYSPFLVRIRFLYVFAYIFATRQQWMLCLLRIIVRTRIRSTIGTILSTTISIKISTIIFHNPTNLQIVKSIQKCN